MKIPMSRLHILLESRDLQRKQEATVAELETNRRRRRKRFEINPREPLQRTEGTDENVLLPGHAHPTQVKSADLHSDLHSNATLREDQTFFADPSKGAINQNAVASQQQATSKKGKKDPTALEEDVARAHSTFNEANDPMYKVNSMVASNEPPASDPPTETSSEPARAKGCKAKKTGDRSNIVRAYESNHATITTPVSVTEPAGVKQSSSSSSIAANSTQLPSSVPNLTQQEGRGGLSKGALAGISIAIIFLASIPITIAIIRSRQRQRKRKLSAMFDKGSKVSYPVPSAPDLQSDHQGLSPTEIGELMNRVASVQLPKPTHQSKLF